MSERAAEKVWIVTDYPSGGIRGVFRSQVDAEGLIASIRADHPDLQRSDFSICVHWFSGSSSRPPVRGESAVQKVWIVSDYPRGGIRAVVSSLESAEAEITAIRAEHPDLRRDDFTVQVERVRGGVEKGLNICLDVEDGVHRCSGCGHRWQGLAVESGRMDTGAELCGDCWRTAQPVLHGPPVRGEQETAVARVRQAARHVVDLADGVTIYGAADRFREAIDQLTAALLYHDPAPVRAEAAKAEQRSIVLCPQCQSDMPRERHDRGLFPARMAEWCDRCLPAFSPLLGKSASPVREAELRRDVDVALSSLSAARLLLTNGDHADALEELDKGIAQVKPLLLAGLREAEPLKALVDKMRRDYCEVCKARCAHVDGWNQAVDALSAALEGAATKGQGND